MDAKAERLPKEIIKKIIIGIAIILCSVLVIAMLFISRSGREEQRAKMRQASDEYIENVLPDLQDKLDVDVNVEAEVDPGHLILLCTENDKALVESLKPQLDAKGYPAVVVVKSFGENYLSATELKSLYDQGWGVCLAEGFEDLEAELVDAGIKLCPYIYSANDRILNGPRTIGVGGSAESACKNRIYSCISRSSYLAIGIGFGSDLDKYSKDNVDGMLGFLDKYIANDSLVTTVLDE